MGNNDFHIRLGVKNKKGHRSGVWRIWTAKPPKNDIYIACRSAAGNLKVSLHESDIWRVAFTKQFADNLFNESENISKDRLIEEWKRPNEIVQGATLAFRILIPNSELEKLWIPKKKVKWIIPEKEDQITEIILMLTKPTIEMGEEWPGEKNMNTKYIADHTLPNQEKLWLVYVAVDNTEKWENSLRANKKKIFNSIPKMINWKGLFKAENPRMIAGGMNKDGSRYYIDLSISKSFLLFSYMKLILATSIEWVKKFFKS